MSETRVVWENELITASKLLAIAENLKEEVVMLKSANGWISVDDRLPPLGRCVAVSDGKNVGYAKKKGIGWAVAASNDHVPDEQVSYWKYIYAPVYFKGE